MASCCHCHHGGSACDFHILVLHQIASWGLHRHPFLLTCHCYGLISLSSQGILIPNLIPKIRLTYVFLSIIQKFAMISLAVETFDGRNAAVFLEYLLQQHWYQVSRFTSSATLFHSCQGVVLVAKPPFLFGSSEESYDVLPYSFAIGAQVMSAFGIVLLKLIARRVK